MRAEWASIQLEVADVMQKLGSLAGRASKIEGLLKRHVDGPEAPSNVQTELPLGGTRAAMRERKQMLRRRLRGGSPQPAEVSDVDGSEGE